MIEIFIDDSVVRLSFLSQKILYSIFLSMVGIVANQNYLKNNLEPYFVVVGWLCVIGCFVTCKVY